MWAYSNSDSAFLDTIGSDHTGQLNTLALFWVRHRGKGYNNLWRHSLSSRKTMPPWNIIGMGLKAYFSVSRDLVSNKILLQGGSKSTYYISIPAIVELKLAVRLDATADYDSLAQQVSYSSSRFIEKPYSKRMLNLMLLIQHGKFCYPSEVQSKNCTQ